MLERFSRPEHPAGGEKVSDGGHGWGTILMTQVVQLSARTRVAHENKTRLCAGGLKSGESDAPNHGNKRTCLKRHGVHLDAFHVAGC